MERFLFLHHREKEIGTGKSAAAAVSNKAPASSCLFIARSRVSKPIAVVVGPPPRSKQKKRSFICCCLTTLSLSANYNGGGGNGGK